MAIMFDGKVLFEGGGHTLKAMSWEHEKVERGFAGLDGVMRVDLGRRSRVLNQRGCLTADSVAEMRAKIDTINDYINGQCYELKDEFGTVYRDVCMEGFSPLSGNGLLGSDLL